MEKLIRSTKQVGDAIHHLRRLRGLTQTQLAEKTMLRQATISTLENGNTSSKLQTLFDVLTALDLELIIRPRTKGSAQDIEDIFNGP